MPEDQSMQAYSSSKVENIYYGDQFYIIQSTDQFALLKMHTQICCSSEDPCPQILAMCSVRQ